MEQHHKNHLDTTLESEIQVTITYQNKVIKLYLEDDEGNVPELEFNHEKLLHLIIVSEDLNEYFHLHPVQKNDQAFEIDIALTGHSYKAFVDIKPKRKNYTIKGISVPTGENIDTRQNMSTGLNIDEQGTKEINGVIVEFQHDSFETGKDINLNFNIKNAIAEPYLGALGHVVIIDEKAEKFIHVHPISNESTFFQTQFDNPGLYKLWAEFKFDGAVTVYPFVIKVF
ncbi:hypothetical protein [Paenisporosarcina antarctica]|uniref:Secreted protein n=1 Tax=Paenisporosarcina antarctica TaxID=417367 RepID=A0A4P6ZY62_9BACL|nr:hypothetical protein [Paenisporosarcina antarctica]QBP41254.1 hypothetical protein E2636_08945 [Paenisporosarcina antarctica]